MEDAADDAGRRRFSLALFAHSAQMVKQEDLIGNLDADIAEGLLRFEVNDPYETCFGYLCLIEVGSDIPWTYNAAVAVLMAAARKLPWNARALDELGLMKKAIRNTCMRTRMGILQGIKTSRPSTGTIERRTYIDSAI